MLRIPQQRRALPWLGLLMIGVTACGVLPGEGEHTAESRSAVATGVEHREDDEGPYDRDSDGAGRAFQDDLLEDGHVTRDEYEAAVTATVDCIREAGLRVDFPSDGEVIIDVAVDPAELLTFAVHVPDGVHSGDTAARCQAEWSFRVEQAWQDQLTPAEEERRKAVEAALACGRERGQEVTGSEERDAFQAVMEHGCRPWEDLS